MLLITSSLNAQTQQINDSLEKLLRSNLPDTIRIKILGDLAWNYQFSDPNKAIQFANNELKYANKIKDDALIGQSYSDLGAVYTRINSIDSALLFYNKALEFRKKTGNKEKIAGVFSNIGTVLIKKEKYSESIKIQLEALKYFEETGNEAYQANTLGNIGSMYNNLKDFNKAKKYWEQSLKLSRKVNSIPMIANNLSNLMTWYYTQKDYRTAVNLGNEAMAMLRELGNDAVLSQVTTNQGVMYIDYLKLDSAEILLTESMNLKTKLGDRMGMAITGCALGRLYLFNKDYKKAEKYLLDAITCSKENNSLYWLENAYTNLYSVYEAKGEYKNAFEALKVQKILRDSLIKLDNLKSINELETKYGVEKKDRENKLLAATIQRRNLIFISVLLVISSIIVFIFMFFKRKKLQQELVFQEKLNIQQDQAGRSIIEAEERERKRIATDLHDGLGQMLSVAKMNLSSIADGINFKNEEDKNIFGKTLDLVDETCKEARDISHQMMPNALLKSGLASAVKEFLDKIDSSRLKINLTTHGINERLDENIESVLYRVIQESVNNIIKHAKANQLDIQLIKDADEISVTIEDNGVGFDVKDASKFEGIGLKNMLGRVQFLKGTLDIDSTIGKGTFMHVSIPLN
ncbi:MAG: sensor histidine kinase [Bacteroidetes bacterium]|nr:sensor histidine kinase [Bacteroidota bacterium]